MNITDKTSKHRLITNVLPIILVVALTACTRPDTPETQTITLNTETTTATTQISEGQLEYYTERYLAPHERLKRRQDRLNTLTQN